MLRSTLKGLFISAALVSTPHAAVAEPPIIGNQNPPDEISVLVCKMVGALSENYFYYNNTQQLLIQNGLEIGCLLQDRDDNYNVEDALNEAVLSLQNNLAVIAATENIKLSDTPDGKLGPKTTSDFIEIAIALKIDVLFIEHTSSSNNISLAQQSIQRLQQEVQKFAPDSFTNAQEWAQEQAQRPRLPNLFEGIETPEPTFPYLPYKILPLCKSYKLSGRIEENCAFMARTEVPQSNKNSDAPTFTRT